MKTPGERIRQDIKTLKETIKLSLLYGVLGYIIAIPFLKQIADHPTTLPFNLFIIFCTSNITLTFFMGSAMLSKTKLDDTKNPPSIMQCWPRLVIFGAISFFTSIKDIVGLWLWVALFYTLYRFIISYDSISHWSGYFTQPDLYIMLALTLSVYYYQRIMLFPSFRAGIDEILFHDCSLIAALHKSWNMKKLRGNTPTKGRYAVADIFTISSPYRSHDPVLRFLAIVIINIYAIIPCSLFLLGYFNNSFIYLSLSVISLILINFIKYRIRLACFSEL